MLDYCLTQLLCRCMCI